MNIKKTTCAFITSGLIALSFATFAFAATLPAPHQAPVAQALAKDYLVSANFDPKALFIATGAKNFSLTLPEIGMLQITFDKIGALDGTGKVLRWVGHLNARPELQATFVRGISGNVTGMLDTPKGRVLLGNANGQYFFHSEAPDVASNLESSKLPAILLSLETRQPSADKQNQRKPNDNLITYPVEFNAAGLANLKPGEDTQISLPGTGDFVVTHDQTQSGDLGGSTFVGHLKDYGDDFRVLVTYTPTGAQGSILTPYGEFQLQTLGANQWILDVSRSKLEQHSSDNDVAIPGGVAHSGAVTGSGGITALGGVTAAGSTAAGTTTTSSATTSTTTTTNTTGKTQIDVLVLYTPGLEKRFGGVDQTMARIQLLTALSNQAYQDSNVNISLRLVKAIKLDIPDTTTNSSMLSDMLNGAGYFTTVAALRQTYGADLVTLVRPFYLNEQGRNCGVGYIGGYGGSNIAGYKNYGLSVVSDGTDMTGQGYYCNNYTFTHELGHNMGSMHDRATVTSQGGGTGAYPYAFGNGQAGAFGTIMSYISPVVGKFSNPSITCSTSSLPCGVPASDAAKSADNAQSLNNTRTAVAAFMPSVNTLPLSIVGVVASKGTPLANVTITPSTTSATCSKSGSNGVYSCTVPANWSGSLTPSLSGYQFLPIALTFSNVTTSAAQKNFEASLLPPPPPPKPVVNTAPVTVTGTILSNGRAVANVPIYSTSASVICSKTNTNGTYSCRVPASWSGSLVPIYSGYAFAPSAYSFNKLNTNVSNLNYQAIKR